MAATITRLVIATGAALALSLGTPAVADAAIPAKFQQAFASSKLPTPAVPTQWIEGDCPAYAAGSTSGCAYEHAVYVAAGESRETVLHEYFHQVDRHALSMSVRTRFAKLMGIKVWNVATERVAKTSEFHLNRGLRAPASEIFADVAMTCATEGLRYKRELWGKRVYTDGYYVRLTRKSYNTVCGMLARGLRT